MAFRLECVFGVEREGVELAFGHLWDEAFQIVHADDGTATDVVLPGAHLEVGPVDDGHAGDVDFAFVLEEGVAVELLQALGGVEQSRVGGGLQTDEIGVDRQAIGLVFVFAHAEVVGLDEFDKAVAFDDAARKLHLSAADLVQIVTKEHDDLADFSIGGIVCKDDVIVPNELALGGCYLLRCGKDMDVLRKGAEAEKA